MSEIDELSLAEKLFGKPLTRAGRWTVGLALGFVVSAVLVILWESRPGKPGAGFQVDPLSGFLVIAAALCGTGAAIAGMAAMLFRRERSLLVFLSQLIGDVVLLYAAGEVIEALGRH
jgi:hypothetical protein